MATSWNDAILRGCDIAYTLQVEGIPVLFTEREIKRVDSASAVTLPSGYTAACPALLISDQDSLTVEIDRQAGVSRGDAWDILLAWNALEDAGLLDDLFARPSYSESLAAVPDAGSDSVLEHNGTTIKVTTSTGLVNGQTVHLGKETITVGVVDGDGVSLTGCTRGVAGNAYTFNSQSFGNYRQVTNRPALWRGRFVELHAHLVSREGRIIDSTWLTGTYHRVLWRGYLDSPPTPDQHGMRLRALPLIRLAGNDLGFEVKADIVNAMPVPSDQSFQNQDLASMMIMCGGQATERITISFGWEAVSGGAYASNSFTVPQTVLAAQPHSLAGWAMLVRQDLNTLLSGTSPVITDATTGVEVNLTNAGDLEISIRIRKDLVHIQPGATVVVSPDTYWLPANTYPANNWTESAPDHLHFTIPIEVEAPNNSWIPVKPIAGAGIQDITIPSAAVGILDNGEAREIVRWSEKDETLLAALGMVFLRVVDRQINGTPRVPYATGGTLSVASGHADTLAGVIRTILESSGTGTRGAYDTLQLGQGLGVPADYIDHLSITGAWQVAAYTIAAVSEGRSSLQDMVGGWLALAGLNLTQAIGSSGEAQIAIVGAQPVASDVAVNITAADLLLESVGSPQAVDTPNEVKVDASGLDQSPGITVRDVPRIQCEGPRSWEIKAPSIDPNVAIFQAQGLIAQGDGQAVVSMTVAPWVDVQPGAVVKLTTAHPAMFDWTTGARAPAAVYARCVGWTLDLTTTKQRITLLLSGGAVESSFLAPVVGVALKSGDTLTLASAGGTSWFTAGDYAVLYTPGNDTAQVEELQILSINSGANSITFTSTPASWVGPGTTITVGTWTNATTAQKLYMYVNAAKAWGV